PGSLIDPASFPSGDLDQVSPLDQGVDRRLGGGPGDAQYVPHPVGGHDGGGEEVLGESYHRVGPSLAEQLVAQPVLQLDEPNGALLGVSGLLSHAPQEERQPRFEITPLARPEQMVVILAPVLIEEGGQVEEWLGKGTPQDEHQRDDEAP